MDNLEKEGSYAKTIALRYISRSAKSVKEVETKLKKKDIDEHIIGKTIDYLKSMGYLNDDIFARDWAVSKIKNSLWGSNRIIYGLRQKGISEQIIKQVIENLDTETTELDTAKIALKKWLKKQGHGVSIKGQDKLKQKQKAFRHLHTKGFSIHVITTVIKKILHDGLEIDTDYTE